MPSALGPADEHDGDAELVDGRAGRRRRSRPAPCRRPWRRRRWAAARGRRPRSVDLDGLAAVVPAAVAAHDVGQLGRAAAGADAARRRVQRPGRGPAAPALRLGGLLLRDGHQRSQDGLPGVASGQLTSNFSSPRRRPAGVDLARGASPPIGWSSAVGPGAVVLAQRRERQRQEHGVADQSARGRLVARRAGRSRLRSGRVLEDLLDLERDRALTVLQAAPALARPRRARSCPDRDGAVAHRLEGEVGVDRFALGHPPRS